MLWLSYLRAVLASGYRGGDRWDTSKNPFPAHFSWLSSVAFVSDPINPKAQVQKARASLQGLPGQVMYIYKRDTGEFILSKTDLLSGGSFSLAHPHSTEKKQTLDKHSVKLGASKLNRTKAALCVTWRTPMGLTAMQNCTQDFPQDQGTCLPHKIHLVHRLKQDCPL